MNSAAVHSADQGLRLLYYNLQTTMLGAAIQHALSSFSSLYRPLITANRERGRVAIPLYYSPMACDSCMKLFYL